MPYRDTVVRLDKRTAKGTAAFSGDFRKKRLRISSRSYPGQLSVKQSVKIYYNKSKNEETLPGKF